MGSKGKEAKEKDETAGNGPQGFAELCQRTMATEASGGCGSQMQEMMSRCLASFRGDQETPR